VHMDETDHFFMIRTCGEPRAELKRYGVPLGDPILCELYAA
jgi:hypothetical protein